MDAPSNGHSDRKLRIITVLTMVPAIGLLIPAGVFTEAALPALGLVPMAMSSVLGMASLITKGAYTRHKPLADLVVMLSLLVIMIPSWMFLANAWWIDRRVGMLSSYAMMPMIVNLCIHIYLFSLSLPTFLEPQPCPNCNHTLPSLLPRWQQQKHVTLPADTDQAGGSGGPGYSRSSREAYHPFMRSYDQDARESSEFQTSGFNTPRQSAETLQSSVRASGEGHGGATREGHFDVKEAGNLV